MSFQTSVYVIGTAAGLKKVGLSSRPQRRCRVLDNAGLRGLRVLHERVVASDIARKVEGRAHFLLEGVAVEGEWFRATLQQAKDAVDEAVACGGQGEQAKRKVGRKKQWTERLTLPLDKETLDRLDAVRGDGEARLDVIREGLSLVIKRREKKTTPRTPSPSLKGIE